MFVILIMYFTGDGDNIYHMTSVIQWITSCHNNVMTTLYKHFWQEQVTS